MRTAIFFFAAALSIAPLPVTAEPTIFLARHAEKSDAPGGDPKNPDLSPAGRTRAESLGRMLKDAGVVAIFATEYKRTQQTAEEVRRATGATLTITPAKEMATLIEQLKSLDRNAVVIGHSNTLPEIIKGLGVETPISIAESDYDNLLIWNRSSPGELVRLHY